MKGNDLQQRLDLWRQTKYRIQGKRIFGSTDRRELAIHSRIITDLIGEFYADAIPRWVSGDLADLGCGKAPLLGAYREYCSTIYLADWANSLHDNPILDHIVDLNEPLSMIESNSLDTIILSDVLEHIRQPTALMDEISRVLRPGGRLIMNVPFLYWIHEAPHDYYRYTNFALRHFAENSGLEVVHLVALGGWLEIVSDLWSKLLAKAKMWVVIAAIHRAVIAFHHTPLGREIARRSGEMFPIGFGMVAQKPGTVTSLT